MLEHGLWGSRPAVVAARGLSSRGARARRSARPRDLSRPGSSLCLPRWQADSLPHRAPGEAHRVGSDVGIEVEVRSVLPRVTGKGLDGFCNFLGLRSSASVKWV